MVGVGGGEGGDRPPATASWLVPSMDTLRPAMSAHCCCRALLSCPVMPTRVQGMVTHVTDVKPLASVLTYLDTDTNTEVYQEVRGRAAC